MTYMGAPIFAERAFFSLPYGRHIRYGLIFDAAARRLDGMPIR